MNTRTLFRCRHEPAAGTMALPGAGLALAAFLLIGAAGPVGAQQAGVSSRTTAPAASTPAQVAAAGEGDVLTLGVGTSKVVEYGSTLARVSIGDPDVADAVVVSAREVVVNARKVGTTTLLAWDQAGQRHRYEVDVTADAGGLQRNLDRYFPGSGIQATATGNAVVLSGTVPNQQVVDKALDIAKKWAGTTVPVVDNIKVPDRGQILLQVRFAEVNRSAMKSLGVNILRMNPNNPRGGNEIGVSPGGGSFSGTFLGNGPDKTFSDAVDFYLFHSASKLAAFIQALKQKGLFKSLAEPNLMAVPGDTASFLAGGEFPFPVVQGGGSGNAVTIQFREFGIRLNFVPTITNSGAIRMRVAPEVSSLDFSNGLEISGFKIPTILSRKATTTIELGDGQTFAIAGLLDNSLTHDVNKVPILGDIPILGALFRSESIRQNRSELLVLVTPHIVQPLDEAPPVPTGEPNTWGMDQKALGDTIPSILQMMGQSAKKGGGE
ncbi:MAG: type II and III secretion system protein family protein [Candidatus Palauibacterales bacterium]|nr:type II and III secretion system protein family protein [Candidatus Palauibacterales bacterium]